MTLDEINDNIQRYVSRHGEGLDEYLLELLADLDWFTRFGD